MIGRATPPQARAIPRCDGSTSAWNCQLSYSVQTDAGEASQHHDRQRAPQRHDVPGHGAKRDLPEQHRGKGQHDYRHQLACVLDVLDQHQYSGDAKQPERDQRRHDAAKTDRIPTLWTS